MGRLRILSGREVCVILAAHGFTQVRQRGSHIVMQRAQSGHTQTVIVPDHGTLRVGTLLGIIRQSGVERLAFESP